MALMRCQGKLLRAKMAAARREKKKQPLLLNTFRPRSLSYCSIFCCAESWKCALLVDLLKVDELHCTYVRGLLQINIYGINIQFESLPVSDVVHHKHINVVNIKRFCKLSQRRMRTLWLE